MLEKGHKLGWKVLNITNCSCFAPRQAVLQYSYDEPTSRKPGCGPLAVFKSEKAAQHFVDEFPRSLRLTIHSCKYVPSKLKYESLWYKSLLDDIECHVLLRDIPAGTAFADVVQLLKR